jgi:F-type H+-transporting ATPase subunit b
MKKFFSITCFVLVLSYSRALAADEGMPQLNPEFWAAQIFWLVLIFSTLYIAISKIFLPKIINVIENRKLKIVSDIDEAQKLRDSAESKLKEYNQIIENSKKEAQKLMYDNKKQLDADLKQKKQKFSEEIEKELVNAEEEIKELKKTSLLSINKIATEITNDLLKKIMGTNSNMSSVSAIVEDISKREVEKNL